MSEQSRPLSRRERRELEERAAAGLEASTGSIPLAEAAPPVTGEIAQPTMSRRERRRLERLENPVETWTAEEETAHTGQIPTVTPEVIAQQEALAREKAEAAQQDAKLATGEMAQVSPARVSSAFTAGPPPVDMRNMFPEGSLQAKRYAEQVAAYEAESAAASGEAHGRSEERRGGKDDAG